MILQKLSEVSEPDNFGLHGNDTISGRFFSPHICLKKLKKNLTKKTLNFFKLKSRNV
jgi:hypothetical protein